MVNELSDYKVSFTTTNKKGAKSEAIKMTLCAPDEDTIKRYIKHTYPNHDARSVEIVKSRGRSK
jgi:hypothetical protein